jgi:hypothetical protein
MNERLPFNLNKKKGQRMGKQVRVFLGENDFARLTDQINCKRSSQNCFFCDLLDCRYINQDGKKTRVGLVRLYGKDVSVIFSPQEGCWLPYPA